MVIMSGVTPKYSAPNGAPRRPKPVITSSKISRMPCLVQISRRRLQVALAAASAHRWSPPPARRSPRRCCSRRAARRCARARRRGARPTPARRASRRCAARSCVCGRWSTPGSMRAEELAVVDHAADGDAAEADAVVAALAADEAGARAFAAHAVVGERDLQRGVHRLRAGVGEEHVVEPVRQPAHDLVRRARTPPGGPSGTAARSPSRRSGG